MIIKKTSVVPVRRKRAPFEEKQATPPVFNIPSFSADKNPNIFSVVHETRYQYTGLIKNSKHLFRLQPISDLSQFVISYEFRVSSNGEICNFTGVFGNHASFVEIKEPYKDLTIESRSIVAVSEESNRMDLIHQPRTMPLIWMPWDRVMLQAYLQTPELPESELFELADYAMSFVKKNRNDVFAVLKDMNQTIFQEHAYVSGSTTIYTTPYQFYRAREGVCQDFANLMICLCRLLDIPARYRVGYIYTGGNYENKIQSDASHAWVEVYLPYLGWTGFDPTNGSTVEKNHIRIACGRHFNDATPTSGTIFNAASQIEEQLTTSVQVLLLNET